VLGGTAANLQEELQRGRGTYRSFVFSGHGSQKTLGFMDVAGGGLSLPEPEALASLLGSWSLQLVVLNGCNTEALARRVRLTGIPHVLCWKTSTEDGAACCFVVAFFTSHCKHGRSLADAFADACQAVRMRTRRAYDEAGERLDHERPEYELRSPDEPPSAIEGYTTAGYPLPFAAGLPLLLSADGDCECDRPSTRSEAGPEYAPEYAAAKANVKADAKVWASRRNGGGEGSCDIFASYKQNDGSDAIVMNMYHELKPIDVWLDKKRGDERSASGMVAGVLSCELFCAVISPAYFQSDFCMLEMRTAIEEHKPIAVCFNGSKFKVQDALKWIPAELASLKNSELIMLHEDDEFMHVALLKVQKRLGIDPQELRSEAGPEYAPEHAAELPGVS